METESVLAKGNCEKIGLERAKSYIRERYGIDNLNITSVIASESGENEIWPDRKRILRFKESLEKRGLTATVRRTLGADIDASCGQLRNKAKEG